MATTVYGMRRQREQGAALIVGMIMLLLLTMIGVAGMRDTLLQEKMAGNMRDREVALQAAEAALRVGEAALSGVTEPAFTNSYGLYDLNTSTTTNRVKSGTTTRVTEVVFWRDNWTWQNNNSVQINDTLDGAIDKPRYVIEKLKPGMTQEEVTSTTVQVVKDKGLVEVKDIAPDYRITARGVGASTDAVVFLQGTFRR